MLIFMFILLKCNVAYVVFPLKIVCIKLDYSLYYSSPLLRGYKVCCVEANTIFCFEFEPARKSVGWLVGWLVGWC